MIYTLRTIALMSYRTNLYYTYICVCTFRQIYFLDQKIIIAADSCHICMKQNSIKKGTFPYQISWAIKVLVLCWVIYWTPPMFSAVIYAMTFLCNIRVHPVNDDDIYKYDHPLLGRIYSFWKKVPTWRQKHTHTHTLIHKFEKSSRMTKKKIGSFVRAACEGTVWKMI